MSKEIIPQTEEVISYRCKWCGELHEQEYRADECALKHAKIKLANTLLEAGFTLFYINNHCGFNWKLSDEQKEITKDNCFIISHWQGCGKPAYKITAIEHNNLLRLRGKGGWSGYYSDLYDVEYLPVPHLKEELFIYNS